MTSGVGPPGLGIVSGVAPLPLPPPRAAPSTASLVVAWHRFCSERFRCASVRPDRAGGWRGSGSGAAPATPAGGVRVASRGAWLPALAVVPQAAAAAAVAVAIDAVENHSFNSGNAGATAFGAAIVAATVPFAPATAFVAVAAAAVAAAAVAAAVVVVTLVLGPPRGGSASVFALLASLSPADPARAAAAPTRDGPHRLGVVPAITVPLAPPAPPPPPPVPSPPSAPSLSPGALLPSSPAPAVLSASVVACFPCSARVGLGFR